MTAQGRQLPEASGGVSNSPGALRTIYADVSEIVLERGNTGIQRVVRRIVAEAPEQARLAGLRFVPVVATANGLRALSPSGERALASPALSTQSAPLVHAPIRGLRVAVKRLLGTLPGVYETLRTRMLDRAFHGLVEEDRIRFKPGDIYLILDSFWLRSAAPRAAERLRRRGRAVVAVIYDVLSVTRPDYFVGELPALFARQLHRMAAADVRFVSISQEAASQTESVLPADHPAAVLHFPLGHDFEAQRSVPEQDEPYSMRRIFLVVGTIEARKNHGVVLDAFERLWADGFDAELMIVGKKGWGVDALLQRLASHPELGKRLVVEHAASDEMLSRAYCSATATIVASLAEGFGLPLIESLASGKPVIASDIPVFREVVGDVAVLFDPTRSDCLAQAVRHIVANLPDYRRRTAGFVWPTWEQSAAVLIERVLEAAEL